MILAEAIPKHRPKESTRALILENYSASYGNRKLEASNRLAQLNTRLNESMGTGMQLMTQGKYMVRVNQRVGRCGEEALNLRVRLLCGRNVPAP